MSQRGASRPETERLGLRLRQRRIYKDGNQQRARNDANELIWDALNKFIIQQGGWVTSLRDKPVLRIEAPQGSALPSKLSELGYSVRAAGSGIRITPTGIVPVDILEIELPAR